MAKKKLLNEAQVRRFMGLAGLGSLSENMGEVYEEEPAADEEEAVEDDMGDAEAGMDGMEPPAEEPSVEPEAVDSTVELEQEDVDALADLSEKLPAIVAKLQGEAPAMDMDVDMDAPAEEPVMDMGGEEDELGAEEEDEEPAVMQEDDSLSGVNVSLSEDEIIQEVTRRVTRRILKAKRAQQQFDEALGNKRSKIK
tara:strand:+ start:1221 stop:1808 length:588 start_codon:yes stop_codon:yes gene_type:complete